MAMRILLLAVAVVVRVSAGGPTDDDQYALYTAFVAAQNDMGSSVETVASTVLNVEVQAVNWSVPAWLGQVSVEDKCPQPDYGMTAFVRVRCCVLCMYTWTWMYTVYMDVHVFLNSYHPNDFF